MARVFLLGGYDLEMLEIKKLLKEHGEKFIDKELSWGASLSSYNDIFNDEDIFVGIELEVDIQPPKHYVEIDHHGKNIHKPSSIEQIAKILGIELNRWQKLVSANDARYIFGMQKLCATPQEIQKIRDADRAAQGVTSEDERLAQKSLKEAYNHLIYSYTSHFSTIADRVYAKFTHYVIFNDNKVVFYGFNVKKVIRFLEAKSIKSSSYYYGGGDYGFVGIKEDVLLKDEIKNLVEEFDAMTDEVISYHTFMFPFVFEGEFDRKDMWDYHKFEIKEPRDYNEYVYFYKHVQDALFNKEDENNSKFISKYYEYKDGEKGTYTINTKNKGSFTLQLDGISLRIFKKNIAILSFNLKNTHYHNPQDILAINDFGRRIYPQFLGEHFTDDTKKVLLAQSISLKFPQKEIYEDFTNFNKIENLAVAKLSFLPKFIKELISPNFINFENIRPIIDDRMFVISQYHNDALANRMKNYCDTTEEYMYENDDFWYEYIFIDGNGKNCQSRYMTKDLIKQSTYDRWVEYGTLFGISRYSFVSLTGHWFGNNRLLPHTQTMYFQIFSLLLAYRATIIEFSDEIQDITSKTDEEIITKAKDLYKRYLNFLNKLYFKEVTAQDQGIEFYNKAMQIMDIPKYMVDLDNEINELHHYVDMIEEKKRNKKLDAITYLGGFFLPLSLVLGFFGINVGKTENFTSTLVTITILATIVITGAAMWYLHQKKEHHE